MMASITGTNLTLLVVVSITLLAIVSVPSLSLNEKDNLHHQQSASHPATHRRRRLQLSSSSAFGKYYSGFNATNSNSSSNAFKTKRIKLTIEGTVRPLFFCSTCRDALQQQQDAIMTNLSQSFANVELIAATQKLANALFVQVESTTRSDDQVTIDIVFPFIRQMMGVKRVLPHETYHYNNYARDEDVGEFLGASTAASQFCVTGKNIRVAVLDSGMDYTHKRLGGPGTVEAYEAAYGSDGIASEEHTIVNDALFPNDVVIDGFDFLGDDFEHTKKSTAEDTNADYDPIDASPGHGTAVADAILQVAPDAQLIALKVCSTGTHTCPDFAIAQALEYAIDPNGDGDMEDRVDIINLSLGLPYFSPYYDFISKMLEDTFHLGVVPVVAMGNQGNIPFIAGYSSIAPNVISVGATIHPREYDYDKARGPSMADYSSRGPGFGGMIKPDLVAPSGLILAAAGSGNGRYAKITGTSFSTPLVVGAIALVKEKCGSICSPFALKALLMNNAYSNVRYHEESPTTEGAPITLMGAGELQVYKSLNASFWAYSIEDVQASVSLGVLNVASTMVIRRTLRITNLSPKNHSLSFSSEFRDKTKEDSNALTIEYQPLRILPGNDVSCDKPSFVDVVVEFKIDATKVEPNHMTSSGKHSDNSSLTLDVNEFGGHLIIASDTALTSISLPFMAILRQASDVAIETSRLNYDGKPKDVAVGLTNKGVGLAQVDAFQVLSFGKDEKEANFGDDLQKLDLRMIGYRVITLPSEDQEDCTYLFEWAFQTWEQQARLQTTVFEVQIDVNDDREIDYIISNAPVVSLHTGTAGDILIRNVKTGDVKCAGFHADHHTYSTTTVLRVCSADLGIRSPGSMIVQARIVAVRYTGESETTATTPYATLLTFPDAALSALSYDIGPGQTLESIYVSGSNGNTNGGYPPVGLMLVTDAYRSPDSTGAAAKGTETLLVLADFAEGNFEVHKEKTEDVLRIPPATDLVGPACTWRTANCTESIRGRTFVNNAMEQGFSQNENESENELLISLNFNLFQLQDDQEEAPSCILMEPPRDFVPTSTTTP